MQTKFSGEYLRLQLDWSTDEMKVVKASPLFQYLPTQPISPLAQALCAQMRQDGTCQHFLVDVQCNGECICLQLHEANPNAPVVPVGELTLAQIKALLSPPLTPRETEVTTLLFEGRTIRYIAASLHITEGTVKRIAYNIYQKLGVASQVELVREIYARLAKASRPPCIK